MIVAKNIAKLSQRLPTQMRSHTLDAFHGISVNSFLSDFTLACDTNGIHQIAFIRFFLYFDKISSPAADNLRLTSTISLKTLSAKDKL